MSIAWLVSKSLVLCTVGCPICRERFGTSVIPVGGGLVPVSYLWADVWYQCDTCGRRFRTSVIPVGGGLVPV